MGYLTGTRIDRIIQPVGQAGINHLTRLLSYNLNV